MLTRYVSFYLKLAWQLYLTMHVHVLQVLGILAPNVRNSCISAGQFFAALRLLMHAQDGSDVNEAMLFIQGKPIGIILFLQRLVARASDPPTSVLNHR